MGLLQRKCRNPGLTTYHCQKLCSPIQSDEKLYNRMSTKMQRTLRTAARLLPRAKWALLVIFILIPLESGKDLQLGLHKNNLVSRDFQDTQIQSLATTLGFPPRLTETFVPVRKILRDILNHNMVEVALDFRASMMV